MLSTGAMIKLGKVYGNLMVDVKASNEKLYQRAVSIVCASTGVSEEEARSVLEKSNFACKPAIVSILLGITPEEALTALANADGRIAEAIKNGKPTA